MFKHLIQDAVTLFVVIDPIGLIPLFLTVTAQESPERRRRVALLGVLLSAGILVGFIVGGQWLLAQLEIGLDAFRIAGGIVLLIIGLRMVLEAEPGTSSATTEARSALDLAVFPIAMPFIAGPGTIMTVVLLTDNARFSPIEQAGTTGSMLLVLTLTYLLLLLAEPLQKVLGATGVNVITRILGLLLAALAIEAILTGLQEFWEGPAAITGLVAGMR